MKSRIVSVLSLAILMVLVAATAAYAGQYDLGGKTVTFVYHFDPFESEEMQIRKAEVEEEFNCKLEWLQVAMVDRVEVLTARLMAGDSAYDVYLADSRAFWPLVAKKALFPVGDVLPAEYYENLPGVPRAGIESLSFQGKTYGFSVQSSFASQRGIIYNKDLFEQEGWPDLQELYEEGEWTWDAMLDIALQATKDTDGDGVIDLWGIGGFANYETLVAFGYTNGAEVVSEDESGRMAFTYDKPEAIEALDMYRDLIHVHNVVHPNDNWVADLFIAGETAMQFIQFWQLWDVASKMTEEYGIVPYPMGPRMDTYVYPVIGSSTHLLAANAAEPEALVAITDTLWPIEEYEEDVENMMLAWAKDRTSYAILRDAHDNWGGEVFHFAGVLGPLWTDVPLAQAFNKIMNSEQSSAAAMAEVKDTIQLIIDELFGQI